MKKEDLKELSNKDLLEVYEDTLVESVKQENFRKGGITQKIVKDCALLKAELLDRLDKGADK